MTLFLRNYLANELFSDLISPEAASTKKIIEHMIIKMQWIMIEYTAIRQSLFLWYSHNANSSLTYETIREHIVIISRMTGYDDDIREYLENSFAKLIWDWGYWVRKVMKTKSKRALLWRIAFLTFFLSAILDNLTTSIVMIMILRKLVTDHKDRMVYASLVIIAANSGGAFSPIGDVTTIMLWNKGLITAAGVIAEIFIPSVVSMVIPALILQTMLKGELVMPEVSAQQNAAVSDFTEGQRKAVFWLGVGGLIFVPIFKSITHLPPFVHVLQRLAQHFWLRAVQLVA